MQRTYPAFTYDTALPQDWYDEATNLTGINPSGHIVWAYEDGAVFGSAFAVDAIGELILLMYDLDTTDEVPDATRARLFSRARQAMTAVRVLAAE